MPLVIVPVEEELMPKVIDNGMILIIPGGKLHVGDASFDGSLVGVLDGMVGGEQDFRRILGLDRESGLALRIHREIAGDPVEY